MEVNTVCTDEGAIITVHDGGKGMSEEDLKHIFEPYYRTPEALASGVGGMGIGLFISKEIIDAHHGTLVFTSVLGEGTTATVTLPTSTSPDAEIVHRMNSN